MRSHRFFVYILASRIGGTLYIGVTNELARRVNEHRMKLVPGFTKDYGVSRLVYYEEFLDIRDAIKREKQLKKWNRAWKIRLIEERNPNLGRPLSCTDAPVSKSEAYPGRTLARTSERGDYWVPAFAGMTVSGG